MAWRVTAERGRVGATSFQVWFDYVNRFLPDEFARARDTNTPLNLDRFFSDHWGFDLCPSVSRSGAPTSRAEAIDVRSDVEDDAVSHDEDDDDYWDESNDDPKNISDEYSNSFDCYIEFDDIGQKDGLDSEFEFNIDYTKDKKISSVLQTQKDTTKKKKSSSKDKSSFFDDIPEFTYDNDNM
jgi:hypothetical protein